jgi:N-acetylglucosamine-6-phosphate deacetylase
MSGYVDLQVNGYSGVDFNAQDLTLDDFTAACQQIRLDGVSRILATIITAPLDSMIAKISRIAQWLDRVPEVAEVVAGIHIEGPFINPAQGFVGAHPRDAVQVATIDAADRLCDCGGGWVRMLTLAPEQDADAAVTGFLSDAGIVVAAGHSDASRDQLRHAIDRGLQMYTHLGNGCPALLPRHDNIVQRVLSLSEHLMVSFIADGHHIPTYALRNYLRCVPDHHIVIVTDAISAAGLGSGRFELSGQIVEVDDNGAAWAEGRTHFAGSAATFPRMVELLRRDLACSERDIHQWTELNPSRLLDPPIDSLS